MFIHHESKSLLSNILQQKSASFLQVMLHGSPTIGYQTELEFGKSEIPKSTLALSVSPLVLTDLMSYARLKNSSLQIVNDEIIINLN
jgi:hypothetical protein